MIKDAKWYDARKKGIGGSDAGAVLGVSPYKTPLRLWKEKRGEVDSEEIDAKEFVYWGTILEGVIAQEYSRRTGYDLYQKAELSVHPEYPWMVCNVDRFVRQVDKLITEIKTIGSFAFDSCEWGEDGSAKIPAHYYAQVQHNIAVTDSVQCDMPLLIGGQEFRLYRIPRDEEFIAKLIAAERSFIHSVHNGEPPKPLTLADLELMFPNSALSLNVEASEEVAKAWAELCELRRRMGNAKKWAEQYEFKIKEAMGEAAAISFNGIVLATWKSSAKRRTFRIRRPKFEGEGAEFATGEE